MNKHFKSLQTGIVFEIRAQDGVGFSNILIFEREKSWD